MDEFFNRDGHLTDYAIKSIINDDVNELQRLEFAEHTSFCDECLTKYINSIDNTELMTPPETVEKQIIKRISNNKRRFRINQYFSMAVAACFALIFWVTGIFSIPSSVYAIAENRKSSVERVYEFRESMFSNIDKIFNNIDLKGVISNEKE